MLNSFQLGPFSERVSAKSPQAPDHTRGADGHECGGASDKKQFNELVSHFAKHPADQFSARRSHAVLRTPANEDSHSDESERGIKPDDRQPIPSNAPADSESAWLGAIVS